MPIVIDQAVPSLVQSIVGSPWRTSPATGGRLDCDQTIPPSLEKCIGWSPPSFVEAAIIWL